MASIGILWGILEVTAFFGGDNFVKVVRPYWWVFLILGLIYTTIKCWPKNKYSFPIPNRDSKVDLQLKNSFKIVGSLIIPINNKIRVNTGGHLGTSTSILSQFVKDYYDNKPDSLQFEIDHELAKAKYKNNKINDEEYKIGTVVPVTAKEKQFYLLVNSTLNQQDRSVATKDTLENALNELWTYLAEHAGKEKFIIPILGTGRGRINMTREEVLKEIVLSFVASCSDRNYADKLIVSIHPNDISEHNINLEELVKWVESKVKYADFKKRTFTTGTNVLT